MAQNASATAKDNAVRGHPLTFDDVSMLYEAGRSGDTVLALDGVTAEIRHGEFVSLVGPSGCGKSTLLNIVGGLLHPTKGSVRLGDSEVTGPREEIGMMFQSPVLFPWRTVIDNVLLPVDVHGGSGSAHREQAHELLRRVGLEGFSKRYPGELSGGMQQRVALSRLLLQDAEVMLLDEPFGALDEFTRESMNLDLLDLWYGSDKTMLFVTHNIQEAVFLSDRVFVMTPRPGRLASIIDVHLPRPRQVPMMKEARFQDLVFEVRGILGLS